MSTGSNKVAQGAWAGTLGQQSTASALTATGTTQATGLQLTTEVSLIGTAAASTGVNLPAVTSPGDEVYIVNGGANAVKVYPVQGGSGTINGIAAATGISVSAGKAVYCIAVSSANWVCIFA